VRILLEYGLLLVLLPQGKDVGVQLLILVEQWQQRHVFIFCLPEYELLLVLLRQGKDVGVQLLIQVEQWQQYALLTDSGAIDSSCCELPA